MQANYTDFYFQAVLTFENGRQTREFHTVRATDCEIALNAVIEDIGERWPNRNWGGSILSLSESEYNSLRNLALHSTRNAFLNPSIN